jgi:uncharacterized RDD family membrane protein YckC
MNSPRVTLQSVTGVDIELRVAGPGSRSYAFIIDWHIRLILALAWLFVALFLITGSLALSGSDASGGALLTAWLPPLAIYFLYHPVLEIAMRGRTPGKRIAGVRLVTRQGDIPGAGALLLRNVFRLLDAMPASYLLGLIVVFFTQQHVRVGDLAAGTLLVFEHDGGSGAFVNQKALDQRGLTPQLADLIHELLERWTALDQRSRTSLARSLLERAEPSVPKEEWQQLGEPGLRARLNALVS